MTKDPWELWMDEDQMPSCPECLDGFHARCIDLMYSEKYGMYACGCTNPYHDVEYEA